MKTFLAILFSCLSLNAATYYVDFSSGDDSLSGTSTATAWKHSPGDKNATGTAASATLAAGDTVTFKGGTTYEGGVVMLWSGTSGNQITYDGNSSGVWGVGKAIIDGKNTSLYGFSSLSSTAGVPGVNDAGRNYITVRNFHIQNVGGYAADDPVLSQDCSTPVTTPTEGYGISFDRGSTGVQIYDCDLEKIGQWRNQPPFSGVNSVSGYGISLVGAKNALVRNNTCTKMRTPIRMKVNGNSGGLLSDVNIQTNVLGPDFVFGIDISSAANNMVISNINLEANVLMNSASYDLGNWLGCGEKPHTDSIFLRNSSTTGNIWTNVFIHRNDFYCDVPGASQGGTASIFLSEGPSARIFNNTFRVEPKATAVIDVGFAPLGRSQYVLIANNTFIGGSWNNLTVVANSDATYARTVDIFNNIFIRSGDDGTTPVSLGFSATTVINMDYNLFLKPGFTSSTKLFAYDTDGDGGYDTYGTLANQQARGFDNHSAFGDPLFVTGTDFSTPSLINARLSSGSPAIGAGTDLSAYGVTTDYTGATRSTWDIGAYQYTAAEQGGDGGSTGGIGATGSSFTSGAVTISGGVILR